MTRYSLFSFWSFFFTRLGTNCPPHLKTSAHLAPRQRCTPCGDLPSPYLVSSIRNQASRGIALNSQSHHPCATPSLPDGPPDSRAARPVLRHKPVGGCVFVCVCVRRHAGVPCCIGPDEATPLSGPRTFGTSWTFLPVVSFFSFPSSFSVVFILPFTGKAGSNPLVHLVQLPPFPHVPVSMPSDRPAGCLRYAVPSYCHASLPSFR